MTPLAHAGHWLVQIAYLAPLVLHGSQGAAARSQVVMLVLMVCFTCLGLWLLSAANG